MEKEKTLEQLTEIGKMLNLLLKTDEFPEKKDKWLGCCYESELESFYGKHYE